MNIETSANQIAQALKPYGVAASSRFLKSQVSFAKEPYKRDYSVQKRPIILRRLLNVATPQGSGVFSLLHLESHFSNFKSQSLIQFFRYRIQSLLQGSFAKETYDFKKPTNRSDPILHLECNQPSFVQSQVSINDLVLQVSFAEYSLFCRALLQKRPIILRSLLIVVIPYCIWSVISLHLSNLRSQSMIQFSRSLLQNIVSFIGLFCKRDL